ncbi:hypothetical protein Sjap_018202 [Stephania japonica]|uniref:Elongator complex protein 6 n=1 Tax=Stephania japonica TaxID=461633 RepID=A0AAP0I7M5_9MAGN
MEQYLSLLDQAIEEDKTRVSDGAGRVVLIQDCVETSGAFLLHHLMKRALSRESSETVIFVAFAQPFSHYDRILKKLGCNLITLSQNGRFIFFDMLKLDCPDEVGGGRTKSGLVDLFHKIHKATEVIASPETKKSCITIMIDDLSLVEVAAHGSSNYVLDFLHYCQTLTSEVGCTLILLNHEDIYSSSEQLTLNLEVEYLADIVIKAKPLATGLATDVHGQLTVLNKRSSNEHGKLKKRIHNFQFKVKENGVEYFYSGSRT